MTRKQGGLYLTTFGLAATLVAGCGGGGSSGGGGGTTAPPVTGTGQITSNLPAPQRANAYSYTEYQLNNVQNAGVVTALGVAPNATDTLAIHTPLNEVELVTAAGRSTESAFFSQSRSIASVGTAIFAATTDPFLSGNGDVYRRNPGGAWQVALDTDRSEMVVGEANGLAYAVAGGIGQQGQVYRYDPNSNSFGSVALLNSTVGTAIAAHEGDVWIGGIDNVTGAAKLWRMRSGALEEIQYPYAAGGVRQEVRAMMSVATVISGSTASVGSEVLVLAVGSFDSATGDGLSGAVVATDGKDFEVMQSYQGDAPTSLAFADNTIYVGTSKGKLQYREADGSWSDEAVSANAGIFSLLARDAATLFIGARGNAGALLIQRVAGGVTPTAPDRYYLPDVKDVLANNCVACHTVSTVVGNAMLLSSGLTDDDADFAVVEASGAPTNGTDATSSLLLQKAANQIAHTGGALLQPGSAGYEVIKDWIDQGRRKEQVQAPPPPTPMPKLGYVQDVKPILLQRNCASCHAGRTGGGQFTFTGQNDTADFNAFRGKSNLGMPDQSEVILRNDGTMNHQGGMPWVQGNAERATIIQWINDGAQLNATP